MQTVEVNAATPEDAAELAAVAAATFPLACPPSADPGDIAAFIATTLSQQNFTGYLADPGRTVLTARAGGRIIGYAMLVCGVGDDPAVARAVRQRPAVELSKMYVLADHHRSGAAAALMESGLGWAAKSGAHAVWLGVNQKNERAQRFYRKHGFEMTGERSFRLGDGLECDFVMVREMERS
ncbi:MAG: GNAT family N-acetyltransferase [Mycobacterium sp.]